MNNFSFSAREAAGALHTGQLVAASAGDAAREISARGWIPLRIDPVGTDPASTPAAASPAGVLQALRAREGISSGATQQALGFVLREIAALLKAGIPILRALRLSGDACHSPPVRELLKRLADDLDAGRDLSTAATREVAHSKLITRFDTAMLRVGEQTGRLTESFLMLHSHREFMRGTREQLATAIRYPSFVIGTCVLAMLVVNIFVIPQFAKVFKSLNTELPMLTQVLMSISSTFVNYWPAMLALLLAGGFVLRQWVATPEGGITWARWQLKLPLIGNIANGIVMSRFTRSFSATYGAGLTVPQSLDITAQTLGNAHVERQIRRMVEDLERGTSITQAARNADVFPPTLLQLISIGEETGSLQELTGEMSHHYEHEVTYAIGRLSATVEPLLVWLLGMGVLLLALGVFMPMWELGRASMK